MLVRFPAFQRGRPTRHTELKGAGSSRITSHWVPAGSLDGTILHHAGLPHPLCKLANLHPVTLTIQTTPLSSNLYTGVRSCPR